MSACAPIAQLDRVSASEAEGRGFNSRWARQFVSHFYHKMAFLLSEFSFNTLNNSNKPPNQECIKAKTPTGSHQ